MTSLRPILAIAVIAASLTACTGNAPTSSGTSFAPAAALASYKTYGWSENRTLSLRDPKRNTAEAKGWIESAVDSGLASKGLTKSSAASADLLVGYGAGSRALHSSQTFTDYNELSPNRKQEEAGTGQFMVRSADLNTDYEQGRIVLNVTDRKTGKVVYRGTSEAALLDQASASRSLPRLQVAVKEMLKNWPAQ